jgi:hypothetical protein
MKAIWKAALAAAAVSIAPGPAAADCRATSPEHTVALFELYTSEGCDSCPPADRWLSKISAREQPSRAVALALHVDYWDRLGWTDRFATPSFTARQYEQMHRRGAAFVYTPQVLLQGRDYPQWRSSGDPATAVAAVNTRPARASIELIAQPSGRTSTAVDVHVRVPDPGDRAHAAVAVALVQSGLVSEVNAGENAGKRLTHDRVVRQWRSGLPVDAGGELSERLSLPLPADPGSMAIVAFAEDTRTGDVLQALSLPLCGRR